MKMLIAFLLSLAVMAGEPDLPHAQPGDALYRKDSPGWVISWPRAGGMTRVQLPPPMTLEEMQAALEKEGVRLELQDRREIAKDGRERIVFWLPLIFISIALTFFLKSYGLQAAGVICFSVSVSYFVSGVLEVKMAEKWAVSTWLIMGIAAGGVVLFSVGAFMLKDKGIGKPGLIGKWVDDFAARRAKKQSDS